MSVAAVVYGFAGVVLFILCLAVTIHVWPKNTPGIPFLLKLWLIVGVLTAAVLSLREPNDRVDLIATNFSIYMFIVEAFTFIYGVTVGSLSARIMVSLLENASDRDAFERTLQRYSADFFLDHRLERLVEQGLLAVTADRYYLTPKGQSWARAVRLLKQILAVGSGG